MEQTNNAILQHHSWRFKVQLDIKPLPKLMVYTKRKCILQCFIPGRGITPDVCITVWDVVDRPIENTVYVGRGGGNVAFDWTVITTNGWTVDWWWRRRVYKITLHVIYHKNSKYSNFHPWDPWYRYLHLGQVDLVAWVRQPSETRQPILCNFLKKMWIKHHSSLHFWKLVKHPTMLLSWKLLVLIKIVYSA